MQTTDDQLGHLIQKIENCRTDIVQKLRLDALKNIVADHLALTDGEEHTPPLADAPLPQPAENDDMTDEADEIITELRIALPDGNTLSILMLEVLLHFSHSPDVKPYGSGEHTRKAVGKLSRMGLLESPPDVSQNHPPEKEEPRIEVSERGWAMIHHLLRTPLPQRQWIIERKEA